MSTEQRQTDILSKDLAVCLCQDLQVMKVRRPGVGVICFVAKLNRSSTALPQAVLNAQGTVCNTVIQLHGYTACTIHDISADLIRNHSFTIIRLRTPL